MTDEMRLSGLLLYRDLPPPPTFNFPKLNKDFEMWINIVVVCTLNGSKSEGKRTRHATGSLMMNIKFS